MIKLGFWIVALSYAPTLLDVLLGTGEGNPLGLGLFTVLGSFLGGALILFGLFLTLVRKRTL